jgi:hypothetical protein
VWDDDCKCPIGWKRIDFKLDIFSSRNAIQLGLARYLVKSGPYGRGAALLCAGQVRGSVSVVSTWYMGDKYSDPSYRTSSCYEDMVLLDSAKDMEDKPFKDGDPPDYNALFFNCRHFVRTLFPAGIGEVGWIPDPGGVFGDLTAGVDASRRPSRPLPPAPGRLTHEGWRPRSGGGFIPN